MVMRGPCNLASESWQKISFGAWAIVGFSSQGVRPILPSRAQRHPLI